jgi:hypothetical protein
MPWHVNRQHREVFILHLVVVVLRRAVVSSLVVARVQFVVV